MRSKCQFHRSFESIALTRVLGLMIIACCPSPGYAGNDRSHQSKVQVLGEKGYSKEMLKQLSEAVIAPDRGPIEKIPVVGKVVTTVSPVIKLADRAFLSDSIRNENIQNEHSMRGTEPELFSATSAHLLTHQMLIETSNAIKAGDLKKAIECYGRAIHNVQDRAHHHADGGNPPRDGPDASLPEIREDGSIPTLESHGDIPLLKGIPKLEQLRLADLLPSDEIMAASARNTMELDRKLQELLTGPEYEAFRSGNLQKLQRGDQDSESHSNGAESNGSVDLDSTSPAGLRPRLQQLVENQYDRYGGRRDLSGEWAQYRMRQSARGERNQSFSRRGPQNNRKNGSNSDGPDCSAARAQYAEAKKAYDQTAAGNYASPAMKQQVLGIYQKTMDDLRKRHPDCNLN